MENIPENEHGVLTSEPAIEDAGQQSEPAVQLPEYVDFYLTPTVIQSLKGIMFWAKILVACSLFLGILELIVNLATLVAGAGNADFSVFKQLKSLFAIGFNGWVAWLGLQFIRNMSTALKFRDGEALGKAFMFQGRYFKWIFLYIVISIGLLLLNALIQ